MTALSRFFTHSELGASYIFTAHDLAVVKYTSDEVMVMFKGDVVAQDDSDAICAAP